MDIKRLILKKLRKNGAVRVADVVKATGFSRAYVNRFFNELEDKGKIVLIGKANRASYIGASKKSVAQAKKNILAVRKILKNHNLSEDLVLAEIKSETGIFLKLPLNISTILDYGFTEMLNNAIEHSRSPRIAVLMKRTGSEIVFQVNDVGVGIFQNIMKKKRLRDELEAIQDLLKGKQTTLPQGHSGEGIFFTSKVAGRLVIKGSDKKLIFDNLVKDVFIKDIKPIKGTKIEFEISLSSLNQLAEVFKEYAGEAFEFGKTEVLVKLYKESVNYVSRSQARRILSGLEKFKEIVLDFANVDNVGQAFADEVFRIWASRHRNIKITAQNASENVNFMISRAKAGNR